MTTESINNVKTISTYDEASCEKRASLEEICLEKNEEEVESELMAYAPEDIPPSESDA